MDWLNAHSIRFGTFSSVLRTRSMQIECAFNAHRCPVRTRLYSVVITHTFFCFSSFAELSELQLHSDWRWKYNATTTSIATRFISNYSKLTPVQVLRMPNRGPTFSRFYPIQRSYHYIEGGACALLFLWRRGMLYIFLDLHSALNRFTCFAACSFVHC